MTREMPYFKCYPQDFLLGTQTMNHEDFANYARLIFTMYESGGPIRFDPDRLRLVLGYYRTSDCERKIRKLVALRKIVIDQEGFLHNGRVDYEMQSRQRSAPYQPDIKPDIGGKKGKKRNVSTRARPPVQNQKSDNNLFSSVPYVQAAEKDFFNGSAAMAGSPGFGGRFPATPANETVRRLVAAGLKPRPQLKGH